MSNQDNRYNDIGNKIQQSVADALASGDFSRLNGDINATVRDILSDVGDQINSAVSEVRNGINNASAGERGFTTTGYRDTAAEDIKRHQQRREELRKKQQAKLAKIKFKEIGAFSGPLDIGVGTLLTILFALSLIGAAMNPMVNIPGIIFVTLGMLFGAYLCFRGTTKVSLLKIAKQYKEIVKDKHYATVKTISEATGTNEKQVIKNIKKILSKGYFQEGYMDETNTTFMASKAIYDQYLETKNNQIINQEAEENQNTAEAQLNAMISEGMRYTGRLRELNDRIPGVVITNKLNKLEDLLKEIFNGLREHPDQMPNCRKLMEYYLPTMIKLVEAYEEYDKISQPGPDIIAAKKEIENTLDIINQAFVELLNKLYQSSVWDVTAEAKVLKTMLNQAGLTEGNSLTEDREFGKDLVLDVEEEDAFAGVEQTTLEETVVNNV